MDSYEDYILNIINDYLDYHKTQLEFKLAKASLKDAEKLYKNISRKRKKRIASQTDLDKGRLQVLLRQEDLLAKKREVSNKWLKIHECQTLRKNRQWETHFLYLFFLKTKFQHTGILQALFQLSEDAH